VSVPRPPSPKGGLARVARLARVGRIDGELRVMGVWVALAVVGWWLHSVPLAIVGALGAVTTGALYLWQRECLSGVSYDRRLSQSRASFGETIEVEIEIVNDKLLPLSFLEASEEVPGSLRIEGGTVIPEVGGRSGSLVQVLPLLAYQRVRRRLQVVCTHRGDHLFGPTRLTSGDPVGLRTRTGRVANQVHLVVYPKVFPLASPGLASRVLMGDLRSRFELVEDPARMAGVRQYRPGDPLRKVDWRATARSTTLVVREWESSVTLSVALFLDFRMAPWGWRELEADDLERSAAVAATLASDLARSKVPVGLFSTGVVEGVPIGCPPSAGPSALVVILEALARASPYGATPLSGVIAAQGGRLARGTSAVVVAADFPEETLEGLSELRRHHGVTVVFVESRRGRPPPLGVVDRILTARCPDDWESGEVLELAP